MNPIVQTVLSFGAISAFVLPLTVAFVNWLGGLGVKGRWQLVSSMLTGLVFGGGLAYVTLGMVNDVISIGASVVYGLTVGLSASGTYDAVKEASAKGQIMAIKRVQETQEPLTKPE